VHAEHNPGRYNCAVRYPAPPRPSGRRRRAFTLIELLVTISIIAVLLALLTPTIRYTIGAARGFGCQMNLRTDAFEFQLFADDQLHGDRGDDDTELSPNRFRMDTFQESLYRIDEFWDYPAQPTVTILDSAGASPMRCTEVRGEVVVQRNTPCAAGPFNTPQTVSFGFNSRFNRAEIPDHAGRPRAVPVTLTSELLLHGDAPLLWDVDGQAAFDKGVQPIYSAPSLDSRGPYANDRLWFPGHRHNGRINVGFVGGHVLTSKDPLNEPGWQWGYQPIP